MRERNGGLLLTLDMNLSNGLGLRLGVRVKRDCGGLLRAIAANRSASKFPTIAIVTTLLANKICTSFFSNHHIDMAERCVHKGCGKTFTDPQEECIYHPGPPIFHEGQKGVWTPSHPRIRIYQTLTDSMR